MAWTTMGAGILLGAAVSTATPSSGTARSPDGVPIRYEVRGQGEPSLVFVHCWTCDRHLWDAQVPVFARTHRVVTLDLAGHGESGRGRTDWTMAAYGEDVRAVVEALGVKRAVLIGHSMGGSVIVEAARRMPGRVAALVPVDSLLNVEEKETPEGVEAFLVPWSADYRTASARFVREYMFTPRTDPALIERIVAKAVSFPPDIAIESIRRAWTYDAAAALDEVKAPVHALNADKFPTNLEANRRHASGYKATFMTGVGHYLMLEDPKRFNELLAQVLKDLGPR